VDNWGEVVLSLQVRTRIKKIVSGRKTARMNFTFTQPKVTSGTLYTLHIIGML